MTVCIFGASAIEIDNLYIENTQQLARLLAARGHSLIFGGGKHGLMGAAARGFKQSGAHITGVAPDFFVKAGVIYPECDEFVCPDSMRDRKKYMEDNSDAFIAVPGGIGTYEEFFEVLTLKALGLHSKPIALFNIGGYFDSLTALIHSNIAKGFIASEISDLFYVSYEADKIISFIETNGH